MSDKLRTRLLVVALVLGILSLPMPWIALELRFSDFAKQNPYMPAEAVELMDSMMVGVMVSVAGANGQFTSLGGIPYWFVILLTSVASGFQLFRRHLSNRWTSGMAWLCGLSAAGFLVYILFGCITHDTPAGVRFGWFVAVTSALISLACLVWPANKLLTLEATT